MKCDHCVKGRSCRNPISWGAAIAGQRYYFCTRHRKVKARQSFWHGTKFFKLATAETKVK